MRFEVILKEFGKGMKIWNFFFIEVYFLIQLRYGGDLGMQKHLLDQVEKVLIMIFWYFTIWEEKVE